MGAVTPVGNDVPTFWNSLINGVSGVDQITSFDVSAYSTQIGACVDLNFEEFFDKKELRRFSRFLLFAQIAAVEAATHSGLDIEAEAEQIGVELGSGIGGIEVLEAAHDALRDKGPRAVSPFTVPMMICDMGAGQVAIKLGAKGPNSCSVTACASSGHAMGNAFRLIQNGEAIAMITGGAEAAISPLGLAAFCAARSLSTRNAEPKRASRPFDAERDGFVMGEGAGLLVFEELEHAKKRGATIYGEMIGYGSAGDAYHITAPAPEGEGGRRAMLAALKDAGISPTDIDYINAHGTSTDLNDKNETLAIKAVFGDHAKTLNISSTKSMTGHLLGAAAAIEMIASIYTINEGIIPPTINLENPDPLCDLNYTPNKAVKRKVDVVMSNSLGFGGHNVSLIVKRYVD